MYATHEEDIAFRNPYWDKTFDPRDDPRIIMHDATNLPYQNPSNASQGRSMLSDYYGMACAKGGVSNQLCGWIRGIPLFTGRITDSQMIKDSKILEQQKTFSENDPSSPKSFAL